MLAILLAQAIIRTIFTIYGCPVTSSLLKRNSFPLACLMLSFTVMQAKLYCVDSLTVLRKS